MSSPESTTLDNLKLLPKTQEAVSKIPAQLRQIFHLHLTFMRESQRYWTEGLTKKVDLQLGTSMVRHDVKRRDNTFSFYSESSDHHQQKTVDLTMDRGLGRIEGIEIVYEDHSVEPIHRIFTAIHLQKGLKIEQQAEPIPLRAPIVLGRQRFVFDPTRFETATLAWQIGGEDYPLVTITSEDEIFHGQVKRSIERGLASFEVQGRSFRIPFPFTDQFLSKALAACLTLHPVSL